MASLALNALISSGHVSEKDFIVASPKDLAALDNETRAEMQVAITSFLRKVLLFVPNDLIMTLTP